MKRVLLIGLVVLALSSRSDSESADKDSKSVQLDEHSAINIDLGTTHYGTYDVLATTKTIHASDGSVIKVITNFDTVPSLGLIKDTFDTHRTDDDDNEIDTVMTHPKDYQLYISVKKK